MSYRQYDGYYGHMKGGHRPMYMDYIMAHRIHVLLADQKY